MAPDLTKTLVIGISSRALFDLEESNQIWETRGKAAYIHHQSKYEEQILGRGTGFRLIEAILALNRRAKGERKAEVVVMSKNDPSTSLRLFNSINHYGLDIQRAVLTGGASLAPYLKAFSVDLFLSAHEADVRAALETSVAAAVIYQPPGESLIDPEKELRIAFDGDSVLFSDESERIYAESGLPAFLAHEKLNARKPIPEGPFAKLLQTLSGLQRDPGFGEHPPLRIALVTARNMPAHERVIRTLQAWNVHVDEAFFMGSVPKTEVLRAFRPHIFFDDQDAHCQLASSVVSTGRVPYGIKNSSSVVPTPKRIASQLHESSCNDDIPDKSESIA